MNHYFTNENLKSNLRKIQVCISDKCFNLYTDNGVFSKSGLDFGSRTLIETVLNEKISGDVLDVGCGYGAIGIILSSFFNIKLDMCDVNLRALHLTKMNIKENGIKNVNVFESDIYSNVDKKYDYIITNPPIRVGKEILYKFLFEAKEYLNENGLLYFVINKDQGAKSVIKNLSEIADVEVVKKNKGFFIIKCNISKFNLH